MLLLSPPTEISGTLPTCDIATNRKPYTFPPYILNYGFFVREAFWEVVLRGSVHLYALLQL